MSTFEARARAVIAEAEQKEQKKQRRRGGLRQMLILAAPLLALVMFVSVTKKEVEDDPVGVVTAAQEWAANRPEAYAMTYQLLQGSEVLGPAALEVHGDALTAYVTEEPRLEDSVALTVDKMLLAIESNAVDAAVVVVDVSYAPDNGRPTAAMFDLAGEHSAPWGFRVLDFRVLAP